MIGTNRDLAAMQELLDREILRLKRLVRSAPEGTGIDRRLAALYRQRIAVCAALVNRWIEASNTVVAFARWVSGNGALGGGDTACYRETMRRGQADKDEISIIGDLTGTCIATPDDNGSRLQRRGFNDSM